MASDKTSQFKFQQNFSYALHYLKLGWSIIPIQPRSKVPAAKWTEFQHGPPKKEEIFKWWNEFPDAGVALVTGKVSKIVVLDFDSKSALIKFEKEVVKLPDTMRSKTNRGYHFFFSIQSDMELKTQNQLMNEIDFKGEAGLIILPPSIHESGAKYEWINGDPLKFGLQYLKPLPEKILQLVQNQRNIHSKGRGDTNDLADIKTKINKGSRNTVLFKKACSLLNKGFSKNKTLSILKEINQKKCDPPINEGEILSILKSASRYAPDNHQNGAQIPKEFEELNRKHAILNLDGRYMILNMLPDTLKDKEISLETRLKTYSNSSIYSLSTETDFKRFYRTSFIIDPATGKKLSLTNTWLKSPHARKFDGLGFEPGKGLSDKFNLWTGFPINEQEPIEGKRSCEKFLSHIKYGWANGNEEVHEWILDFLAYPLQYPGGPKAGVALFLLGEQGTGKTLLSKIYGMLFGRHFVHIQAPEQITGRFNRHLSTAIVVLADEVTWGGDRKSVNRLKALVTEETFMCEPKGIDSYSVSNHMNFIITSNDDFVIRTASDERRFCIVPVSNYHKQDHNYFKNIVEEMGNGGLGALIYKLRRRELSLERLRKLPTTTATIDHKIRSMNIVQRYWFERLKAGTTIDTQYAHFEYQHFSKLVTEELITRYQCKWMGNELDERERFAVKDIIYADFMLFRRQFKYDRENIPKQEFYRKLYSCCSGLQPGQNYELIGVPEVKERVTTIRIPPLENCREEFERMIGCKIEWGDLDGMKNYE